MLSLSHYIIIIYMAVYDYLQPHLVGVAACWNTYIKA